MFRIDRGIISQGETTHERAVGVTGWDAEEAPPEQLLQYVRGHRGIEDRLHWVRDETMGEDARQGRTDDAPEVMAALRNPTIGLFRLLGFSDLAAAMRTFAAQPYRALEAVGGAR